MSANLQNPIFTDNDKAREWLERRIWATGRVCPHCGRVGYSTPLKGEKHRPGLYQCNDQNCREQFTVTVGTVFERSKIPLSKWLAALFLMVSSKKGISAHQAHRMLGISYKSTWFMMHRLREAMRQGDLAPMMPEITTERIHEAQTLLVQPVGLKELSSNPPSHPDPSAMKALRKLDMLVQTRASLQRPGPR